MILVYPQINFFPKAVTPWYPLGSIPEVGIVHFIPGTNLVPWYTSGSIPDWASLVYLPFKFIPQGNSP